jgi:hypothetical protein
MDGPTDVTDEWRAWTALVSAGPDEDLAEVFRHVRRRGSDATQMTWARDWRTRTFCDLALHLMHLHHGPDLLADRPEDMRIFPNLQAQALADHAPAYFRDPADADALNVDRFNGTWGTQTAFGQDVLAYLFRPGPYLHRLHALHPRLVAMAGCLTLAEWLRYIGRAELDSVLAHPLVPIHTLVEAVLPHHPGVREWVHRLRVLHLRCWAGLYERIFTAYGVGIRRDRDDLDWLAVAGKFATLAGGALLFGQTRVTDGDSGLVGDELGQLVVELVPALLSIGYADLTTRKLQHPVGLS